MRAVAKAVLLFAAAAAGAAMQYSGAQASAAAAAPCVGFINFELQDDAASAASAEANVAKFLDGTLFPRLIPMWLRQQCTTQLRRFVCLNQFTPIADTPTTLCASVCEDVVLHQCSKFFATAPEFQSAWQLVMQVPKDCSVYPTSDCTTGGSDYEMFPQDAAVCPKPLQPITPFFTNYDRILAPALVDIADCSTTCPTYVYSDEDWNGMKLTVSVFIWLSLIVSIAILISQLALKKLHFLNAAFLLSCIGASFGMVVLILSGQDKVYCEDDVYVHDRAPICVAQGFLTIVCSIAIAMTITCQAFDTYIKVILGLKGDKLRYMNIAYAMIVVVFPFICGVVALAAENVGFDTFWLMPMCFYRRTVSLYYVRYLFMYPQIIALSVCALLVILTSTRTIRLLARGVVAQQRSTTSDSSEVNRTARASHSRSTDRPPFQCCRSRNALALWRKIVQYNVQSSIFVLAYCALSAGCLLAVVSREQNFTEISDESIKHVSCVLTVSVGTGTVDGGIDECGKYPDGVPPISQQGFLAAFYGGPGVFAFLIYAPTLLTAVRLLLKHRSSATQHRTSQFLSSVVVTSDKRQTLPQWQVQSTEFGTLELTVRAQSHAEMAPTGHIGSTSAEASSAAHRSPTDASKSDPNNPSVQLSGDTRSFVEQTEFDEGDNIQVGGELIAQVVSHLGQGQFGNVYSVQAAWTAKQLAMKCARIPHKDRSTNSSGERPIVPTHDIKAFCEEARTSLHAGAHHNIVSLRYVCENNTPGAPSSQFLLFYDLVNGSTLLAHLQTNRRNWMGMSQSLEDVQRHLFSLTYQLMNGLEWLHSRRVIHFDIKPDNILVDMSGARLQITDFGLARVCQEEDDDDQPVHKFPGGTAAYRSPEIASIQQRTSESTVLGPKSTDLWAAALTILQIYCCGQCPWYVNAPKASPGENGSDGMNRFQASKKDQLFNISSWQELAGRRKSLVEMMWPTSSAVDGITAPLQDMHIREALGFFIHDSRIGFLKSEMGLRTGEVMKLRRLGNELAQFSMPPALESLLVDALCQTVDTRPVSVEEWKSRLAEPTSGEVTPSFQSQVIDETSRQGVEIVSDSDMAVSFMNIGLALHQVGQHNTARSSYLEALRLAPSEITASALYNLATSCYAIGQSAETKRYLLQLLDHDPTYARAYYTLSKFSRDERNLPEMAQYLEQCIEHDTDNKLWKAHWKFGRVKRLLEGPGVAMACYQACMARFAHCPNTHAYLALELFLARRVDDALKHARTAADMDPKTLVGNYVIAQILMARREEKDARQVYQRLEHRYGQSVHFSMGDLFWAYGADRYAVDAYTFASAYDPENAQLSNRVQELVSGTSKRPTVQEILDWITSHSHKNFVV